ncbi:MAG: Holliday junction ATP-dependent DNA helicase RuvB [Elusimicrobia bacterium ADurb.Bin231]|nr:MAG: Holliday junction ATP-dependent DNA helicase RuvB [Elusimicrobia bacterium ADurb.Bin231]
MEERILTNKPVSLPEEQAENSIRPQNLNEFIGQEKIKENLAIFIAAARKRKEPLDHCLFYSPPGLGKTTLANIIAHEMGVNIKVTSGPVLEKAGDLAAILTNLSPGDVLFIDEIHRLNRVVEESLYPVIEDFKFDIIIGQGPSARNFRLDIPKFTLVGATTRAGLLTSPLKERFGISAHIDFYSVDNLKEILRRSAGILSIKTEEKGIELIAKRSRGTPRIANRLLRRIRDFADMKTDGVITALLAEESLGKLEIDSCGLDNMDVKILRTIIDKFSGGPVGIETIAVAISEETDTVTDVFEPYLIQAGFLTRTPRGRVVTELAYKHLGLTPNTEKELI